MTKDQAKEIFETYNPASDVVRCPNGKAQVRELLDRYAKAAVNLYGVIRRDTFVKIFNAQNEEQTTADEVYSLLLPNVLKFGYYGFYKNYIVHYAIFCDFDRVTSLRKAQAGKPRYVPAKEQFLRFESEEYEDNTPWQKTQKFLWDIFGDNKETAEAFLEIKNYIKQETELKEVEAIMNKHNLVFESEREVKTFYDLLTLAANNTRMWKSNGCSPHEMTKLIARRLSKGPTIYQPKNVQPDQPYDSGATQISHSECKFFYETWYKLLDFVNKRLRVVRYKFSLKYPDFHDEILLHKIREKLWEKPQLISEFIKNTGSLSDEEISLLQSWEKHFVMGEFILIKYEPEYTVFMHVEKNARLYAVKGMTTPIEQSVNSRLPAIVETVLLPFGDKIIYDSFMSLHDIKLTKEIYKIMENKYIQSKEEYGVALTLSSEIHI